MHRTHRPAALLVALVIAVATVMSGCSDEPSSSAATNAPTTTSTEATSTTEAPTLEDQITADFQGVQLDMIEGTPEPGLTTIFFQEGSWAAMATWKSEDEWCLAGVFDWTVTDATSPTEFTVQYDRTEAFPECLAAPTDERFALEVAGMHQTAGRPVYDATFVYPGDVERSTVRTVCGTTWDHEDRCGVDTFDLEVPTPPAG